MKIRRSGRRALLFSCKTSSGVLDTRVEVLAIAGEGNFVKLDWDFLLRHTGEQRRRPRPTIESQKLDAVDVRAHNGNDYLP